MKRPRTEESQPRPAEAPQSNPHPEAAADFDSQGAGFTEDINAGEAKATEPAKLATDSGKAAAPQQIISQQNHYQLLDVPPNATLAVIERAYRNKAIQLHPDRLVSQGLSPDQLSHASEKFQKLVRAYDCLRDPRQRHAYDSRRGLNLAARATATLERHAQAHQTAVVLGARATETPPPPTHSVESNGSEDEGDGEEYVPQAVRPQPGAHAAADRKPSGTVGPSPIGEDEDGPIAPQQPERKAFRATFDPTRFAREQAQAQRPRHGIPNEGEELEMAPAEEYMYREFNVVRPTTSDVWGIALDNESMVVRGLTGIARTQLPLPLDGALRGNRELGAADDQIWNARHLFDAETDFELQRPPPNPLGDDILGWYRLVAVNGVPVPTIKEFVRLACKSRSMTLGFRFVPSDDPPA